MIASMGCGGAEAVLHNVWPELCRSDRYEFEICLLNAYGHFGRKLVSEGATVHCLDCEGKYDIRAVSRLRRLIRRRSCSIVHAHLFPELYVTSMATLGMKDVQLVYTEHQSTTRRRRLGIVARMLDRLAYAPYSEVISVNASTQGSLVSWQPGLADRAITISNCVRRNENHRPDREGRARLLVELGLSPSSQTALILFASRLHHRKGADVLLSALTKIKDRDCLCIIAGEGEERATLTAAATSIGLHDRIRFVGFRDDVPALLTQVDLMILPSRFPEGMPIVILEAMAAGCPIIATNVDGIAELLLNETSALLVCPDDDEQLANAICRLLSDAALGSALARQASLDAEAYLAENAARQLFAVYDRLLGEARVGFERRALGERGQISRQKNETTSHRGRLKVGWWRRRDLTVGGDEPTIGLGR